MRTDRVGVLAAAGLLIACAGPARGQDAPAPAEQGEGQIVVVQAIWLGHDVEQTHFYVFSDAAMKQRIGVFPAGQGTGTGGAVLRLKPGEYYVMAIVDCNANQKPDAGDGFGFYGADDISVETRPQPLRVGADEVDIATVRILMMMDEQGRLVPAPQVPDAPGRVVGTVTGAGDLQAFVLLLGEAGERPDVAALVREDGSFELQAPAGDYELYAFADANGDGKVYAKDLQSWRWLANEGGPPVKVVTGEQTDLGELVLTPTEGIVRGLPAVLAGRVTGAQLAQDADTTVSLYADQTLHELVATVRPGADGRFCVALEPGSYYAKAMVDLDRDGSPTSGDMLGFLGVADLLGEDRPQPLALGANAVYADAVIPLTARLDDEGKLLAIKAANGAADNAE